MMLRPWWIPERSEEVEQVLGSTHFAVKPVCSQASQRDLQASRRHCRLRDTTLDAGAQAQHLGPPLHAVTVVRMPARLPAAQRHL
jgi:hypothetical protein